MTLTQILNDQTLEANEKLTLIDDIVTKCRENYGNQEAEADAPEVPTSEGMVGIEYLSDADKLAVAERCITGIRCEAIELIKHDPLAVLDQEVTRLLATSPLLVNLKSATSGSELI